jgi:hypothetical protein
MEQSRLLGDSSAEFAGSPRGAQHRVFAQVAASFETRTGGLGPFVAPRYSWAVRVDRYTTPKRIRNWC